MRIKNLKDFAVANDVSTSTVRRWLRQGLVTVARVAADGDEYVVEIVGRPPLSRAELKRVVASAAPLPPHLWGLRFEPGAAIIDWLDRGQWKRQSMRTSLNAQAVSTAVAQFEAMADGGR